MDAKTNRYGCDKPICRAWLGACISLVMLVHAVPAVEPQSFWDWFKFRKPTAGTETLVRDRTGAWRAESRSDEAQKQLAEAEEMFRKEEYSAALRACKRLAKKYKDTPIEEDALYMIAECQYQLQRLPAAQDAYAKLLTKYPTTRRLPEAIQRSYDIAYFWLEDSRLRAQGQPGKYNPISRTVNLFDKTRPILDTEGRAIETIETIHQFDPFGPLTDDAVMMAGAHEFVSGDYVQAATYYEQLTADQPKSQHTPKAMVLGGQAYLRAYEGPDYDGQDLTSAGRLLNNAAKRADALPPDQKLRVEKDLRVVYLEQARRDFHVGMQYRQLRKPESARFYFEKVRRNYPDTDWARRASEEIAEIDRHLANQRPGVWERLTAWSPIKKSETPSSRPALGKPDAVDGGADDRNGSSERDATPTVPRERFLKPVFESFDR